MTFRLNEQREKKTFLKVKKNSLDVRFHSVIFLVNCNMGNKASTANWSVDDWAYGTGENAVTIEEVAHEAKQIPIKYFGGAAIENNESMHQMRNDLLAFDETIKNLFRRKKNKRSKRDQAPPNEYYYEEQQVDEVPQLTDLEQNNLQPVYTIADGAPSSEPLPDSSRFVTENNTKAIWRCGNCAVENKITERVCRRCGQTETRF